MSGLDRIRRAVETDRGGSAAPPEPFTVCGDQTAPQTPDVDIDVAGRTYRVSPLVERLVWGIQHAALNDQDRAALLAALGHDNCVTREELDHTRALLGQRIDGQERAEAERDAHRVARAAMERRFDELNDPDESWRGGNGDRAELMASGAASMRGTYDRALRAALDGGDR